MALLDDTRATWSARRPTHTLTVVPHRARVGRVWHWAGPATGLLDKPHSACLTKVRDWQLFHQRVRGWADIGYNVLICPHARAIEGRGLAYAGAHSPSWNDERWGFQYMTGQGERVTAAMLTRGARLAQDVERLAGHDLDDKCHHDDPDVNTACPGPQLTAWVRTGGPETKPPPLPPPGKDPLVDHATFKRLVREVLAEEATTRALFNTHRVMVEPATGERVSPARVIEVAAGAESPPPGAAK